MEEGSQGSQTEHATQPRSRATATCFQYWRSVSGIRFTQAQSLLWKRREPRWLQNGSPGSATATAAAVSRAGVASVSDGSAGAGGSAAGGGVTGAGSVTCRVVSAVLPNSSLAP